LFLARNIECPLALSGTVFACFAAKLGGWSQKAALIPSEWGLQNLWTLWTAHLAHYSWAHLVLNLGLLCVGGFVAELLLGRVFVMGIFLMGAPVISLGVMLLEPHLVQFRGASGIATALIFGTVTWLWLYRASYRFLLALACLAFATKLMFDANVGGLTVLPNSIQTSWSAHVMGALVGLLLSYRVLRQGAHSGQGQT